VTLVIKFSLVEVLKMTKLFLVGGAVRDLVLGNQPNDFDYVLQCDSFEALVAICKYEGFLPVSNSGSASGFVEFPDTLGIKAIDPYTRTVVDIHCARKEFNYSDGAHPEVVTIGTIHEDLARRDFTCNALILAREAFLDGDYQYVIDVNGGLKDIEAGVLRCVGNAVDRLTENPDRVIRALRFACRYNWKFSDDLHDAFLTEEVIEKVRKENDDRKFKSLNKILKDKSLYPKLFDFLYGWYPEMAEAILSNIGLKATNEKS
jgi:tRNA nucleotidyltransferase/poly(A) polymerase